MPRVNTTIDIFSPLIVYAPSDAWLTGNVTADPEGINYQDGTFIVTEVNGSTASFAFNGTGVWLFGAKRGNHGNFSVALDNTTQVFNGNVGGNGIFQTPLFGASGLPQGAHHVVVTNLPTSTDDVATDLDYIIFESVVGDDQGADLDVPVTTTVASKSSGLYELGGTGWKSVNTNQTFQVPDGMYTSTTGDTLSFAFEVRIAGDSVSVFGGVGPLCGQYEVSLDGDPATTYNATRLEPNSGQMLFFAGSLGDGTHTLLFTNLPPNSGLGSLSGNSLVIQQITNQSVADTSIMTTQNTTLVSSPLPKKSSGGLSSGLTSGIVSAVVVFVVIFAAFLLYHKRRSRSKGMVKIGNGDLEGGSTNFDIDGTASSFGKLVTSESKSKSVPIFQALSSLRSSFMANIRHRISYWHTARHRNSSALYITAWNPNAGVNVVQLPPVAQSSSSYNSSGRNSRRDPERSRRRRHRKRGRERELERELQIMANHIGVQLGSIAGTSESDTLPSSSRRRHRKRRERRERREHERDVGNSSTSIGSRGLGRLRSFRNSRIVRAARNLHLAKPGSSTNGSTYAPTVSGFTSEISERPTMTLSPISEAPPPLPSMPASSRTLLVANQT